MTLHYPNPALEAELAYRREQLTRSGPGAGRPRWSLRRRPS